MTTSVFRGRAFVSLLMLCSFAVVAVSGLVLYAAPRGPAGDWFFLWLSKREWASLHVVFSVLFPALVAVHLAFNWKPLVSYIKRKIEQAQPGATLALLRLELLAALVVCVLLGMATLNNWPPASLLMDLRTTFRGSGPAH